MVLGIKDFKFKSSFKKAVRKKLADKEIRTSLQDALNDLLKPQCPNGRNLEKLTNHCHIWSIRYDYHLRISFTVDKDGIAHLRKFGSHDEVYSSP